MKTLLQAQWIAPMDSPVLRDGAVVFDGGRILAVGDAKKIRREHPDANVHEYGQAVIVPGLVNAHTHLELSDCLQDKRPGDFVSWLKRLIERRMAAGGDLSEIVKEAVAVGVNQCLRFGVTTVGDISRECAISRIALREGPLRVISYGEVQALGQRRVLLEERLAAASDRSSESQRLRVGLTPHAPYTVEEHAYRACLDAARTERMPLATHLAENSYEGEFLANHAGPFMELWNFVGRWDNQVPKFEGGPIRFAQQIGLLDYPTLLAHVNYCDDAELELLSRGNASVVYCPRTHSYFGHPPHRWREMLARGINIAIGTDSCASSPDLNIVDDLRLVYRLAPEMPVEYLWSLITTRAASAMEMHEQAGSLSVGKAADAVVFDVGESEPLRWILENNVLPREVWIDGTLQ